MRTADDTDEACVVDLDADLLCGNLAEEAFWARIKRDWRAVLGGRTPPAPEDLDFDHLPWNEAALERIARARAEGRRTVLRAETEALGEAVSNALGGFDAIDVAPAARTRPRAARPAGPLASELLRAMRPYQWVKNLLVFLPMILGHDASFATFGLSLVAFLSFSLIASAVYLVNDLSDLAADRRHPTKRTRPFAAGRLPLSYGTRLLPALLATGFALALLAGWGLFGVMVLYALITSAYSLRIKGLLAADIIVIAVLYALRIIAGSVATGIAPSLWFLSFTIFIFFSLAAVKRLAELTDLAEDSPRERAAGRAYTTDDRPVVAMLATGAGMMAVLVLMLYVDSSEVRAQYRTPEVLWAVGLVLLFWISRTVLLAYRGLVNQDPLIFALTDRVSQLAGITVAVLFVLAIVGLAVG